MDDTENSITKVGRLAQAITKGSVGYKSVGNADTSKNQLLTN
jgi:hypothetical protein